MQTEEAKTKNKKPSNSEIREMRRRITVKQLVQLDMDTLTDAWEFADRKESRSELREKIERAIEIKDEISYETDRIVEKLTELQDEKKSVTAKLASLDAEIQEHEMHLNLVEAEVLSNHYIDN